MVFGRNNRLAGSLFSGGDNNSSSSRSLFGLRSSNFLRNAPAFGPEAYSPGFGNASGISLSDTFKLQSLLNNKDDDNRSRVEKFRDGYVSAFKEKEKKDKNNSGPFGMPGTVGVDRLTANLTRVDPSAKYGQYFIPGEEGGGGFNPLGALTGGITGFSKGGFLGAVGGAVSGGFA
mgnify:FL=1|tara:strand:+ start:168 stop:692 length:525 start_codon:yes stop_codon:yes gene_type:complete